MFGEDVATMGGVFGATRNLKRDFGAQRVLDAPFTLAHVLMVLSYVVVLGGTLLDNAQLFDQVSRMAASDSLTGLGNHRRLLEVLQNEIERSRRTRRTTNRSWTR